MMSGHLNLDVIPHTFCIWKNTVGYTRKYVTPDPCTGQIGHISGWFRLCGIDLAHILETYHTINVVNPCFQILTNWKTCGKNWKI